MHSLRFRVLISIFFNLSGSNHKLPTKRNFSDTFAIINKLLLINYLKITSLIHCFSSPPRIFQTFLHPTFCCKPKNVPISCIFQLTVISKQQEYYQTHPISSYQMNFFCLSSLFMFILKLPF